MHKTSNCTLSLLIDITLSSAISMTLRTRVCHIFLKCEFHFAGVVKTCDDMLGRKQSKKFEFRQHLPAWKQIKFLNI